MATNSLNATVQRAYGELALGQGIQRIVLTTFGPEAVREPEEVFLVNRIQYDQHRALDDFIFQRRHG